MPAEESANGSRHRTRTKRSVEALIRKIGASVDVDDDRHSRPDKERYHVTHMRFGARQLRIVQPQRLALPIDHEAVREVVGPAAEAIRAAPLDRPFPEGERRRTSDDEGRLNAPASEDGGRRIFDTRALAKVEGD